VNAEMTVTQRKIDLIVKRLIVVTKEQYTKQVNKQVNKQAHYDVNPVN
jgi:hypothetical protein